MEMKSSINLGEKVYSKGDIIVLDFGNENVGYEKSGVRPCVVLSNEGLNSSSGNIIVAPMTNASHKKDEDGKLWMLPTQVHLSKTYYRCLDFNSVLQLEDIRAVSKKRILRYLGFVSVETQERISKTLYHMLVK